MTETPDAAASTGRTGVFRRVALAPRTARWAGPLLITLAVLVVLRGFWLGARLTNQQLDILGFWLPHWCAMGRGLAAGHIPTWLSNQFGGVPFASDPQSGWMYLPVMGMFASMSCARAMELFIVLQPILAGLGLYWFFRHEGVGRPAATIGGLALALPIAGSNVALSMPFAGTLAWTSLSLAGASGFLWARTTVGRVGWLAFTGFAWSQIAAAHMTDGLLIGTAVLGLYVVARSIAQVRSGERRGRSAVAAAVGLFAVLPVLSAAALIPRLALIPRTSIGLGYRELGRLSNQLSGHYQLPPLAIRGMGPWWATAFARGPGAYVGAVTILVLPLALASRRWRWPSIAFLLIAVAGWVLNLDRLIGSPTIRRLAVRLGIGELWLRDPGRFRYQLLLAFAALAGYGVQAWLDRPAGDRRTALRRLWWFGPVVVVFVLGPLLAGAPAHLYLLFAAGAAYAIPLLVLAARGQTWAPVALAGLLAVELCVAGVAGQYGPIPTPEAGGLTLFYNPGLTAAFAKLRDPPIHPATYLTLGSIGRAMIAARRSGDLGRYFTFDERIARGSSRGFLSHQAPRVWPAYENGRSILFGLEEIQGYSPIQLDRYWRLVRASDPTPIFYNSATFQSANPALIRLFGVRWVIVPTNQGPPGPLPPTVPCPSPTASDCSVRPPVLQAHESLWSLYREPDPEPRASVVFDWRFVPPATGLFAVLQPAFDPARRAIVEQPAARGAPSPEAASPGPRGTADYAEPTPEHAVITVRATAPGLLLIRNPYDPNWRATVDGSPAAVFPADYLMQGVWVPAGTHVVDLTYQDRRIGQGLLVSAVA
ncbi:MAG TPA: YfhO family protein, partial [Actinomycetota bacterium]|nr:YfhO family protein [Actinomycetota bacterium]